MATVTLYEELLLLFRRFAERGREAQPGTTIIDVWRQTLNNDDVGILRTLAVLRGAVARGADQVELSPNIDPEDKQIAALAMNALDDALNPNLLNAPFADIADRVSQGKISMLTLLANALQPEYQERTLSADDVSRIGDGIDELGETVRSSNYLDAIFKKRLLGHIDYMNWAVRNIQFAGTDSVYTAFGPPLLLLRQAINGKGDGDDDSVEPKKIVYQRMEELFQRVVDGMG